MASAQRRGTCQLPGCTRAAHIDAQTGVEHDYCGRSHAREALGKVADPHGCCHVCNLDGCDKLVHFEPDTSRVHDFCCSSHALMAQEEGEWPESLKRRQGEGDGTNQCALPGCSAPRFRDPTGVLHDYCGRTHAIKAKDKGFVPGPAGDNTIHVVWDGNIPNCGKYTVAKLTKRHPKYANVVHQFEASWRHGTRVPEVVGILQIRNPLVLFQRYEALRLRLGNEQRRWHGTQSAAGCSFARDLELVGSGRGGPCGNSDCRLCNICSTGFQLDLVGATSNPRYGEGLYFSSTSSKSNDYANGSELSISTHKSGSKRARYGSAPPSGSAPAGPRNIAVTVRRRAMFLCKVVLGRSFQATDDGYCGTGNGWSQGRVEAIRQQGFDSVVAQPPILNYDEANIYNAPQAIPSYVVVYDM